VERAAAIWKTINCVKALTAPHQCEFQIPSSTAHVRNPLSVPRPANGRSSRVRLLATTSGIRGKDVRDLMVAAVEHRFGRVNRLPLTIEWLSDNGSCSIAGDTRSFARDIGLEPRTTPIESPQSNGMAEAFVRTIKRDYVPGFWVAEAGSPAWIPQVVAAWPRGGDHCRHHWTDRQR
jgi:transposase InsO family protein